MREGGKLGETLDRMASQQGVDRAAMAIAWLLVHPAGILPVMGTNSIARIKDLSQALRVKISREDWFELYAAAEGREVP